MGKNDNTEIYVKMCAKDDIIYSSYRTFFVPLFFVPLDDNEILFSTIIGLVSLMDARNAAATHSIYRGSVMTKFGHPHIWYRGLFQSATSGKAGGMVTFSVEVSIAFKFNNLQGI